MNSSLLSIRYNYNESIVIKQGYEIHTLADPHPGAQQPRGLSLREWWVNGGRTPGNYWLV